MTRQESKELLPIIQAFAEGKTIEVRVGNDTWIETDEVYSGHNNDYEYRVKPIAKYRPFTNAEECWQEMQKHQPFGWVKSNKNDYYRLITEIRGDNINPIDLSGYTGWTFPNIIKSYTFADGTPFGIKE